MKKNTVDTKQNYSARGLVHKYGDNIDTDVIIPARHLNTTDPKELAKFCLQDLDDKFASRVKAGEILVAGSNFGCGSSREHAPISIKALGISCVIASSFARIFYRNAINIGLPILESENASKAIQNGDKVAVDYISGTIINETKNEIYKATPFPEFIMKIVECGGLLNYLKTEGEKK